MDSDKFILEAIRTNKHHNSLVLQSFFLKHINSTEEQISKYVDYKVFLFNDKFHTKIDGKLIELTNTNPITEPLVKEGQLITAKDIDGIPDGTELPIGRLVKYTMVNLFAFKGEIPYQDKNMSVRDYDKYILNGLNKYLLPYARAVKYLTSLATIINVSTTQKTLSPPKGIKEFVAKESKKYDLSDPLQTIKLDNAVKDFIANQLKDDPSFGKNFSKKILTRYNKLFGMYGAEESFGSQSKFITKSLADGLPRDAETVATYLNVSRTGSLDRGNNTQIGGVIFNLLAVVSHGLKVEHTDCGTKDLLEVNCYSEDEVNKLADRYTNDSSGKPVRVKLKGPGKYMIRSPEYCRTPGTSYCQYCIGDDITNIPEGIVQAMNDVSRVIISFYMSAIHGRSVRSITLDAFTELF